MNQCPSVCRKSSLFASKCTEQDAPCETRSQSSQNRRKLVLDTIYLGFQSKGSPLLKNLTNEFMTSVYRLLSSIAKPRASRHWYVSTTLFRSLLRDLVFQILFSQSFWAPHWMEAFASSWYRSETSQDNPNPHVRDTRQALHNYLHSAMPDPASKGPGRPLVHSHMSSILRPSSTGPNCGSSSPISRLCH